MQKKVNCKYVFFLKTFPVTMFITILHLTVQLFKLGKQQIYFDVETKQLIATPPPVKPETEQYHRSVSVPSTVSVTTIKPIGHQKVKNRY